MAKKNNVTPSTKSNKKVVGVFKIQTHLLHTL
jgi:hypothetical protein